MQYSAAEQRLLEALCEGRPLDLGEYPVEHRTVSATALRHILTSNTAASSSGFNSVVLQEARIEGNLDLAGVDLKFDVSFAGCTFDDIDMQRLKVGQVEFFDCRIGELNLAGASVVGNVGAVDCTFSAPFFMPDAQIGGTLSCKGSVFRTRAADSQDVEENEENPDEGAESPVSLYRTTVHGDVLLDGATVSNRDLRLGYGANLSGMTISGGLAASRLTIYSCGDCALNMVDCYIERWFYLEGLDCSSTRGPGMLLTGAKVSRFDLIRSNVSSAVSVAMGADGLQCRTQFTVSDSTFSAVTVNAALEMSSMGIGSDFILTGCTVRNGRGPSLNLDSSTLHDTLMSGRFFSNSEDSAVDLISTRISGYLQLFQFRVENLAGPAVCLDRSVVDGAVYIVNRVSLSASGPAPVFSMAAARIRDELRLVFRGLYKFNLPLEREVYVLLDDVSVGTDLYMSLAPFRMSKVRLLSLDGLTFRNGPWICGTTDWLTALRESTPEYFAQPYRNLALQLKAQGHEVEWRRVLIRQQRDLRIRGQLGGPLRRAIHLLSGAAIGYGYKPWRALAGLFATIALALTVVWLPGSDAYVHRLPNSGSGPCSGIEKLRVGASYSVPIVNLNARRGCDVDADAQSPQWPAVLLAVTQVGGWAFATLFVAGFTGLVRRNS